MTQHLCHLPLIFFLILNLFFLLICDFILANFMHVSSFKYMQMDSIFYLFREAVVGEKLQANIYKSWWGNGGSWGKALAKWLEGCDFESRPKNIKLPLLYCYYSKVNLCPASTVNCLDKSAWKKNLAEMTWRRNLVRNQIQKGPNLSSSGWH